MISAAVCLVALSSVAAPSKASKEARKALKEAERLQNDAGKAADARKAIAQALADSVLAGDAKTYVVAGKIEASVYADALKKLSINRNDPKVDRVAMADALLAARKNYIKAMERDSILDSKGRMQTRYSSQIADWLSSQTPQYYNSGIAYLNKKLYYPQAYEAFMTYAESPSDRWYDASRTPMTDSARAKAYFYAGVMAFNAREYKVSAEAFEQARRYNYPRKEVLLNQMVCYRKMADADSTLLSRSMRDITRIAGEGVRRFGTTPPLFIEKYVAGSIWQGKGADAVAAIDSLRPYHPADSTLLSTLLAETYLAMGDTTAAIREYTSAASDSLAAPSTLLAASKLYAAEGIREISKVKGSGRNARRRNKKIIEQWLRPALVYAERGKASLTARKNEGTGKDNQGDDDSILPDLENTIATIQYYMIQ